MAPIYSIHDSLVTTESYKDNLRELMIAELEKWTNNKPKVEEKKWNLETTNTIQ